MHDRFFFNQTDTAAIFGVSISAFKKWSIAHHGKRGRELLYYLPAVVEQRALGARDFATKADAVNEKARLDRVRADLGELELRREMRQVVPIDEAARLLESVAVAFRLKILALPTKAAPVVLGCKTLPQTKAVLADVLDEALGELAELNVADLYHSGDGGKRNPAAQPDIGPVGRRKKKAKPRGKRGGKIVS